jgi:hypothetical protein
VEDRDRTARRDGAACGACAVAPAPSLHHNRRARPQPALISVRDAAA